MKIIMQPVEMIAHFYPEGFPRPVKFRIKENEEYIEVKIERVISKSEEKNGKDLWLLYKCECIVNGQKRLAEFKFEKSTCRWILYKF